MFGRMWLATINHSPTVGEMVYNYITADKKIPLLENLQLVGDYCISFIIYKYNNNASTGPKAHENDKILFIYDMNSLNFIHVIMNNITSSTLATVHSCFTQFDFLTKDKNTGKLTLVRLID